MDNFDRKRMLMIGRKIIVENGIYHVTQRAPGKEVIFIEDRDYLKFLHFLKQVSKEFAIDIFCFALLPNHVHMLLKIKEANLSEAMKRLFQKYAQWFNEKYGRKGHVFCGAYRAALCQDDKYLITASLYIHLNPFKAGLTKDIFGYRWTSLACYTKRIKNSFVQAEQILNLVTDAGEGRLQYEKLIEDCSELRFETATRNNLEVKIFSQDFTRWFAQWPEKILQNSPLFTLLSNEAMLGPLGRRRRVKLEDKKAFVYRVEQLRAQGYRCGEIADKLGVNRVTIYRIMQQKC